MATTLTPVPLSDADAEELRTCRDGIHWAEQLRAGYIQSRDQAILKAARAGASLREIATHCGLTHAGVADVLKRQGHQR